MSDSINTMNIIPYGESKRRSINILLVSHSEIKGMIFSTQFFKEIKVLSVVIRLYCIITLDTEKVIKK